MKILIAKTAGFCMGVRRAVDLALEHSGKTQGAMFTLGPLIHNKQTIETLKQRGVDEIDESKLPDKPTTILVRAHGVPPNVQNQYSSQGHKIIDGTCPKVKTVHKVIQRFQNQGYAIVITGDEGHAEVIGLMGYAGDEGYLINSPEDIIALPNFSKVCLVSQTTFDRSVFDEIAERFQQRYKSVECIVKKTICSATDQRQAEVHNLASEVDAMIVVGGKNSANTRRLAEISRQCNTPTQHVETEQEIDWESISHCKTIGITAGASTPNWMIKRISDYLQYMDRTRKHTLPNFLKYLLDIAAHCNILVALGAVAIYYTSSLLQGYNFTITGAVLAFFYFISMYLWNSLASIETTQHLGISRYQFYNAHKRELFSLAGVGIIGVLTISFIQNKYLFYLMLFATLAGSAYHLTIVPRALRGILRYKNLKDIPTSRDLFVALAWATVLTFIPQTMFETFAIRPSTVAVFIWIFILAFLRSLIFDLRDIEGDRIMGRETFITIIGDKRARKAIHIIIIFCMISLLLFPAAMGVYQHQNAIRFLFQIPILVYIMVFVKWNPRIGASRSALFNMLADGIFYLAGISAWVSSVVV